MELDNILLKLSLNDDKDISGLDKEEISSAYDSSPLKKWIKLISKKDTIPFNTYNNKSNFTHVANIVLDDELDKNGEKKRNTVIRFNPIISKNEFEENSEWIYIFTIDDEIVKIGGTRTGLKSRTASYLCGHYILERNKSGDCSKTNAYIYNTFEFYLKIGLTIDMYGFKLPITMLEVEILNKKTQVIAQTYHSYESIYMKDFVDQYKINPALGDNSDPNYKKYIVN